MKQLIFEFVNSYAPKTISTLFTQKIFRIVAFCKAPIFQKKSQWMMSQKIEVTFNVSAT